MKRAAWLGSLVAIVSLVSVGCAFQVASQGQDESVDGTSQSLGQNPDDTAGDGFRTAGSSMTSVSDPDKPTPDPWRGGLVNPAKPTPDPWRPDDSSSGSSCGDGTQSGSNPSSTTSPQSGTTSARAR